MWNQNTSLFLRIANQNAVMGSEHFFDYNFHYYCEVEGWVIFTRK